MFTSGKMTLESLRQALGNDFAKDEALRQACLHAPKFGQNDDRADRHAVRVLNVIIEEIDKVRCARVGKGIPIFPCLETDMGHRRIGARTGATPDGRRSGLPTSENTSPSPGSCINGLTALFGSVAKLPLDRIASGALNIRLAPNQVEGAEGLDRLSILLRTFFEMGGLQAQLSVADSGQLRDAQINPEEHRDLMVRITGYSAAFVDMDKSAQDEIIRREEMVVAG